MDEMILRHRRACDGFAQVAHSVPDGAWSVVTPCTEWTARDVVEHVIGFHDFLLLRPMGVRAHRPREDAAARWDATSAALFSAIEPEGALDRATELPGGGTSTPRTMIDALTTDVLVHTWDLARATGVAVAADDALFERALRVARAAAGFSRSPGMIGPEVAADESAPVADRLAAFYGRDPGWSR